MSFFKNEVQEGISKRVEPFLTAYLSFRNTGISYQEALAVSRQSYGSAAPSNTDLLKYGISCVEKIFAHYLNSLSATAKVKILNEISEQLNINEQKLVQLTALTQLS